MTGPHRGSNSDQRISPADTINRDESSRRSRRVLPPVLVVGLAAALILFWSARAVVGPRLTDESTSSSPSNATRVATLTELTLSRPISLEDGTIVAVAFRSTQGNRDRPGQAGFARSADDGATWDFVPTGQVFRLPPRGFAAAGDVVMIPIWNHAGGTVSVFRSGDRGLSWTQRELSPPGGYSPIGARGLVAIDETEGFVVLAGTARWTSGDGDRWHGEIVDTLGRSYTHVGAFTDGVHLIAGADMRIYRQRAGVYEVAHEPDVLSLELTAGNSEIVAWGRVGRRIRVGGHLDRENERRCQLDTTPRGTRLR